MVGLVLEQIAMRVGELFKDQTNGKLLCQEIKKTSERTTWITNYLSALCEKLDHPLVLFIDEIDALIGDSLVNILRQIRAGYDKRPQNFPLSVILCGVRDVRDYRIHTGNGEIITGGSAFNIKAESLRLGNFTIDEIKALYQMHTDETGQVFEPECFDYVWKATEGQPWLVNALAHEATWEMKENRDRTIHITAEMIYKAQEQIIKDSDFISNIKKTLANERVRKVIDTFVLHIGEPDFHITHEEADYVVDNGIFDVPVIGKPYRISNAIYEEIIKEMYKDS